MLYPDLKNVKIAVIGLGNIGLSLAVELGKKYQTIGFDIDTAKISSLNGGINTNEPNLPPFDTLQKLSFSNNIESLVNCNIYIIAVPTSINTDGTPNLSSLLSVSQSIALLLKKNDLIIYESTVFPGCTEDICVPILEEYSGLKFNKDFFVGYSPERINTADTVHTLTNTIKITAGSTIETALKVDHLYKSIIKAGTYPVASIKIAEAAKLLENAQRDANIAFMNTVASMLSSQDIPFDKVWEASSTKWNFHKFLPGLVGGDCLPLASHYLNYLSDKQENILSISRKVNDTLPQAIAVLVIAKLKKTFPNVLNPKILILGLAYKPNTSSTKGSLVPALVIALREYHLSPDVYDPIAEESDMYRIKNIPQGERYHLILKAMNHHIFSSLDYSNITYNKSLIFDVNRFSFKE